MKIRNNKIILFNPRSADRNYRIPVSILQIGASVYGMYDFVIVDGNLEKDPWNIISGYLKTGEYKYFGCTVMPGPQLKQAIPYTEKIKKDFPGVITIWGGYFASNHYLTAIRSGYIDFIIRGCGDQAFPLLINYLEEGGNGELGKIPNLVYKDDKNEIVFTDFNAIPDQEKIPPLPYEHLEKFYPVNNYIVRTFIGQRTFSYHSSFGCPHSCEFCGVTSVYRTLWKGRSAQRMVDDILEFKVNYDIDAVEILDNNFFSSHSRVMEFCLLMKEKNINWWAYGRVDTLNKFTDEELLLLRESGCRMVLMGAETGDDSLLKDMNKGGSFKSNDTIQLVKGFLKFEIIPELSFIFGFPASSESLVWKRIRDDLSFIRNLKKINPKTEIILCIYSSVPSAGSTFSELTKDFRFSYPDSLEEWLSPQWEMFDLRRNPQIPWIKPYMIRRIRNFETVLNAAFPGISNYRIRGFRKILLMAFGKFRYYLKFYNFPYVLKLLLKIFRYQRPEKEGFYSE